MVCHLTPKNMNGVSGIWRIALNFLACESEARHWVINVAPSSVSLHQEAAPAEAPEEGEDDEDALFVLTVPGRGSVWLSEVQMPVPGGGWKGHACA